MTAPRPIPKAIAGRYHKYRTRADRNIIDAIVLLEEVCAVMPTPTDVAVLSGLKQVLHKDPNSYAFTSYLAQVDGSATD